MNSDVLYFGAVFAVVALVVGGGITLALTFYILSSLVANETGVSGIQTEQIEAPPIDPMELALWKRAQDNNQAAGMRRHTAYRSGVMVLLWLALLTGLEFVANSIGASTAAMFIFAIIKAAIIAQYFMHVSSLWFEGGSH